MGTTIRKNHNKTHSPKNDCYCNDHALELKGVHGPRWPVDATKYTFHMCYRCGHTWMTPEKPISVRNSLQQVKTAKVATRKVGGFAVYKITDGVIGYEQIEEEPVKVHPKKATKWLPFRKAT